MSTVAFDTLKFSNQLRAGNFTPEQAQAMTGAMTDAMSGAELATKSDLVILEQRLEKKIDGVKTELEKKIDGVKLDIATVKLELGQKISETQVGTQRFILATVGINAAMILGAMFGLAKLLGH